MEIAVVFAKTSNMTPFRMTQLRLVGLSTVHVGVESTNVGRLVVGRFDGVSVGVDVGRPEGIRVDGLSVVGMVDVGFAVVGIVVGGRIGGCV